LIRWFIVAVSCVISGLCSTYAIAQNLWTIKKAGDGTVVASIAMDYPGALGTVVTGLINIGFGPKRCQPEMGIALIKGELWKTSR
jgi:hypothetical protein